MKNNYPNYNKVDWIDIIEKYAGKAGKYSLTECNGIWITQNEITTIESINNKVLERLAFTLLCLAKFHNFKNKDNNNWVTEEGSEIFRLANISTSAFDKELRFNKLKELNLISYAKKINNLNIQVLYVDDDSENIFLVKDFRSLGNEWRLYKGEKYIRCESCGMLVRKTNNKKKYCKDCAKIHSAQRKYLWDLNNKNLKSEK